MKMYSAIEKIGPQQLSDGSSLEEIKKNYEKLLGTRYESLDQFVDGSDELLFIVNDAKRGTPTSTILRSIDEYLSDNSIDLSDREVSFIIATGSHEPPTGEEIEEILGPHSEDSEILIHRARDGHHDGIGVTEKGTPLNIDERIEGREKIININSVEPHYFAGYTGGRKSLIPGICSWETIEKNHELALQEKSKYLSLSENPVHLDMLDGCQKIIDFLDAEILSLNSVATSKKVLEVKAGDFFATFDFLVPKAKQVFTGKVDSKADIVIARVGTPADKNLYQSLKGFEAGKLICREGGILILISKCYEGTGPREFYEILKSSEDPEEIIEKVEKNYTLGAHKSTNLLNFLKNHDMYIVSDLDDEIVENSFCKPFDNVEEALKKAHNHIDRDNPKILEIEKAHEFVPHI